VLTSYCKTLFGLCVQVRYENKQLQPIIDEIINQILFNRMWNSSYREYIHYISTTSEDEQKRSFTCAQIFQQIQIQIKNPNTSQAIIDFLPIFYRHCVMLVEQTPSEIFYSLQYFDKMLITNANEQVYLNGIQRILQILDERHLFDQLLTMDEKSEDVINWMKQLLVTYLNSSNKQLYSNLCVTCLHLNPSLIETMLPDIFGTISDDPDALSIFLIDYIDLYYRMRTLAKIPKKLHSACKLVTDLTIHVQTNIFER
ncbi:unnamed protein product, partial [Didymodactylos carnosus]